MKWPYLSSIEYTLRSSDGKSLRASETALQASAILSALIKDFSSSTNLKDALKEPIPLENVKFATLELVIDWCTYHAQATKELVVEWRRKFFLNINNAALVDLIRAANFLEIDSLLKSSCAELGRLITTTTMYLLSGLPDEIGSEVAQYLDLHTLQLAAKIGAVPLTPDLLKKAQHAHIWAGILNQEDLKCLTVACREGTDAYLIGRDLDLLENFKLGTAIPRDRSPIHILLAWKRGKSKPELTPHEITNKPFNRMVRLQHSPIMLHLATTSEFVFVDNLEKLVDLETRKTKIISFQHAILPLDVTLKHVNRGITGETYYIDCPGAAEDEDLRIIHQTTPSQRKEAQDWYRDLMAHRRSRGDSSIHAISL